MTNYFRNSNPLTRSEPAIQLTSRQVVNTQPSAPATNLFRRSVPIVRQGTRVQVVKQGPEGKSAYEVAVEEGFVGTEQEWLDSLAGDGVSLLAAHVAAADPHPVYALESALGDAAAKNTGATAGTLAAGDDARFHDSVTLGVSVADVLTLTGQALSADDPGGDRMLFWDDSESKLAHLTVATGLIITGTNISIDSNVATLTGTQTLTNKTLGSLTETVYTIVDAPAFEIDPANGPIQTVTLGANRTPAATNFTTGQSVKLKIDDGSGFSITWTTVNPVWIGQVAGASGTEPALGTTGFTHIELWKEGSTLYGALIGYTAS